MRILMAGQDITTYVDEHSIDVKSILGQGPGVMGGSSGTSSTATFITALGPVASAVGAGSSITYPRLVRGAEVLIYDQSNTLIYGGYGMLLKDITTRTKVLTEVDCYDYWQHMDRIIVNKIYDGETDIYMIRDLLHTYAPWIDTSALPSLAAYVFGPCLYRHISLQKALQKITDTVGNALWIAADKKIHYSPFSNVSTHPFSLSTAPNFSTTFDLEITRYEQDDTSAINRVTFYGGKVPSDDYTQDMSNQANGTNDTFILAYYPRVASDGKVHIVVNGVEITAVGFVLGTQVGGKNKLIRDGGLDQALLDSSAHTIVFNTPPPTGATVTCKYRHEQSMAVTISDKASHNLYGQWYDGFISDQTVFSTSDAVQRCQILLNEQSFGLLTIELITHKGGVQVGQLLGIYHSTRGISQSLMVQEVDVIPQGAGQFKYKVTLGAWSVKLADVLVHSAKLHAQYSMVDNRIGLGGEQSVDASEVELDIEAGDETLHATDGVTTRVFTHGGPYYARSTALNDGHDAFPGFSTI